MIVMFLVHRLAVPAGAQLGSGTEAEIGIVIEIVTEIVIGRRIGLADMMRRSLDVRVVLAAGAGDEIGAETARRDLEAAVRM